MCQPLRLIFSDASRSVGAAFLHAENLDMASLADDLRALQESGPADWSRKLSDMFFQAWTKMEQRSSSTWREVKTIEAGLRAFADRLTGTSVLWFSDSAPGVAVARKGSMKLDLNPLAASIADTCAKHNIDLTVQWLRRDRNKVAYALSRFIDLDDWGSLMTSLDRYSPRLAPVQ